mgnify:CR=1 FL=1|jgi:quercetin dioxygenase-like cupin family protein
MPFFNEIPVLTLAPGVTGHYTHGQSMTLGEIHLASGSVFARHNHPHEQITVILKGHLEMTIDDQCIQLHEGMVYTIPSGAWHSAIAKTDCIVLDVFCPVREEYRRQGS